MSDAKGYIVALVDVRGSGGNGQSFQQEVSGQIGTLEAKDSAYVLR